jgi:endonuclease/exonuclease/phosphatase family metal-dependent hydrolase
MDRPEGDPLRVMTYNVHGCVGTDFRRDLARVARVIEGCAPDVVALQELDARRSRSAGVHQPLALAEALGMHVDFSAARECDGGHYGNALLSRFPIERVRVSSLPSLSDDHEARVIHWARVRAPHGALNVLNTHFGLDVRERLLQVEALLARDMVEAACEDGATVLCGDFNAHPRSAVYKRLAASLNDAQRSRAARFRPAGSFPSLLPCLRIDHVFVSPSIEVQRWQVCSSWRARLASDHLPVVVDLRLRAEAAS